MHALFDVAGVDPGQAQAILAGILTLAGATLTATIVAGLIETLKRLPGVGPQLDAGREYVLALILWAILIVYAVAALAYPTDPVALFGYALAWWGGAKLSGAAYDTASSAKAKIATG